MALLDWTRLAEGLRLEGEGVRLRPPRMADYAEWSNLRRISREFLQPWEPSWPDDDLSRAAFRRRLQAYDREMELGQGYAFFVFRAGDGALTGGVSLSNLRRGVAQTVSLGYWTGQPYARRGYGLAAVKVVTAFALRRLGLHRIEAACLPTNAASARLLLRAGFTEEGFVRAYLKINGAWRDHRLFGLLETD